MSFNATLFGGKAWEAVNSNTTKGNGRTATHDRSGVCDKKLSPGEGEEEEGMGDRTTADDPVFCIKGEKENDTVVKVRGNAAGSGGRSVGGELGGGYVRALVSPPPLSRPSAAHILLASPNVLLLQPYRKSILHRIPALTPLHTFTPRLFHDHT